MTVVLKSPVELIDGEAQARAIEQLRRYMTHYTGRHFERFIERTEPNRFEAEDLIAVSCLSVEVPPDAAAWLLLGDGADECAELLARMPNQTTQIVDVDPAADESAIALWQLLRARHGLGPTIVSKLMAAKRPALIPIFDSFVADALLPQEHRTQWSWWRPWHEMLTGADGPRILKLVGVIRSAVPEAAHLSDLRTLDVVIWMAEDQRRHRTG